MGAKLRKELRRRASVRAGVLAVAVAVLLSAFAVSAKNGLPDYLPGTERRTVQVAFEDAGGLREGDEVRIADIRAGFVSDIELEDGHPLVTMQLNAGREVYEDARATIAARSGLGQKYVDLAPGTPEKGRLPAGGVIPAASTTSPTELDDVLGALDHRTRNAGKSTLTELGLGAAGRGADLNAGLGAAPETLQDLATISKALGANEGANLTQVLGSAEVLSRRMAGQGEQLARTTRQLSRTFDAVATDGAQPFEDTVLKAGRTMKALRPALDELNEPLAATRRAVTTLRPGAVSLGRAMPDLRGFLRESPRVLDRVPGVADDAEPAVERLTPTVDRAQPVVTQLGTTFARGSTPLSVMAPYSSEVLLFFQNAASALSQRDQAGGWLRFYPILMPESFSGVLPVRDPTVSRQAYPAPDEAATHREGSIFGEGFN